MAIKFGDTLENQNSDYPIVDATSGVNLKGVIYSTGLPGATDFPNARANGTILVDTQNNKVYVYQNSDTSNTPWSTADNWKEVALGTAESVLTEAINYSIGSNTFGSISGSGQLGAAGDSALDLILAVLISFQAPTGSFGGSEGSVAYDTTSQTKNHTVTFSVTNLNQSVVDGNNYAISEIKLYRRLGNGAYSEIANATSSVNDFNTGTFSDLNTAGTPTAETFTFNDSFTVLSGSADFNYKVEIYPLDGSGSAATTVTITGTDAQNASGYINCAGYDAPQLASDSFTRGDTSSHFVVGSSGNQGTETAVRREKGNVATKLNFKIDNDSNLVPVTSFVVKRSIDGNTPVAIYSATELSIVGTSSEYKIFDSISSTTGNITGLNDVPEGYTAVTSAFPGGSLDCDTVEYTVEMTDDQGTTIDSLNTGEINFEFPALIGYGTTDCDGFNSSNNSTMTTLLHAIRDTSSLRAQYEIISTSDNLSGVDADFGVVALSTTSTQFVYIGHPADLDTIDTINDPGGTPSYGAFGSAPKSTTVPFTTHYGVGGTYEFYASNSAGSFSGNYTIN